MHYHNLKISKVLLKSQVHQGTSLFTSIIVTCQWSATTTCCPGHNGMSAVGPGLWLHSFVWCGASLCR